MYSALEKGFAERDLLEVLRGRLGCCFVSDLKGNLYRSRALSALRGIDADAFSARQWNDAVEYLTGLRQNFHRGWEAQLYLETYRSR